MNHALLILAHTHLELLLEWMDRVDERFALFLHVDRKTPLSPSVAAALRACPRVRRVEQVYDVYWGDRSIVDAALWLCRCALADRGQRYDYFHLLSGTDFPLCGPSAFHEFFERRRGHSFLEYFRLPSPHWHAGGLDRLRYVYPISRTGWSSPHARAVYDRYLRMQQAQGRCRPLPPYTVYGGSTWWSLTREAVAYVCRHYRDGGWYDRLADTFAPDELMVQTVLLHSPLKGTLVNQSLRYVLWQQRDGHYPAILNASDWPQIRQSGALFARKFHPRQSSGLIRLIQAGWHA